MTKTTDDIDIVHAALLKFWEKYIESKNWDTLNRREKLESKRAALCAFRAGWEACMAERPDCRAGEQCPTT